MGDISNATVVILLVVGGIIGIPTIVLLVGCAVSGIKGHIKSKKHVPVSRQTK